jgi:hypothetical protein
MASRFVVTDHALARFVEQYHELEGLEADAQRHVLLAELERGVAYGGQIGNDALYLLPCGAVAAVAWSRGCGFVKTVLTREHGIANMQSMGAVLRSTPEFHAVIREGELRELAEEHLNAGVSRRRRNALLREQGYDPAGEAGEIYNAAYRAAQRAALEARWAALYDSGDRENTGVCREKRHQKNNHSPSLRLGN